MQHIRIFRNAEELNAKTVLFITRLAAKAIEERGRFAIALSGGSTPKSLYDKLVWADIDWRFVYFFFGDERNVVPDHEESNFRLAADYLFAPLGTQDENIFRWKTESFNLMEATKDYSTALETFFEGPPVFDLILLGLGADGHTASLFPHSDALSKTDETAVYNWVDELDVYRYTLTFPVINAARNVAFLVSGEAKAATLRDVIKGPLRPADLPSQMVSPVDGELYWMIDNAAARLLTTI